VAFFLPYPQVLGGIPDRTAELYCPDVAANPEHKLRVVVVEDDDSARQNLVQLIDSDRRMQLVAAVATQREGMAIVELPHDVIVVDIGLPDGSGIDIIKYSAERGSARRLVSTVFGDEKTVVSALEAGADGYVLKDNERITDAIVDVAKGHVPLTPSVAVHLVRRLKPKEPPGEQCLTARESDVLLRLARGLSYHETAEELSISYHTVTDHIKAIYKKLAVNSRSSAVYQGLRAGLIDINSEP